MTEPVCSQLAGHPRFKASHLLSYNLDSFLCADAQELWQSVCFQFLNIPSLQK